MRKLHQTFHEILSYRNSSQRHHSNLNQPDQFHREPSKTARRQPLNKGYHDVDSVTLLSLRLRVRSRSNGTIVHAWSCTNIGDGPLLRTVWQDRTAYFEHRATQPTNNRSNTTGIWLIMQPRTRPKNLPWHG